MNQRRYSSYPLRDRNDVYSRKTSYRQYRQQFPLLGNQNRRKNENVLSFDKLFIEHDILPPIKDIEVKEGWVKLSRDKNNRVIKKYGKFSLIILLLISLYRIADVVMGVMANIFYLEKGYSIKDIATYSKFFGVFATIIGGLLGGYFASKKGTMTALFLGALIASLSNLLFAWLATVDANIDYLIMVITADNISSGFAGAAFVIYLSGLTSIKFTATQYALFSSIMLFLPKLIAGYSGAWVNVMGYSNYFILTALLGVPVLFLIYWIGAIAPIKDK